MGRSSVRLAAAAMGMEAGTTVVTLSAAALRSTAAAFRPQIVTRRKTSNESNQNQTDLGISAHSSLTSKTGIIDCRQPGTGLLEKPKKERAVSLKAYCAQAQSQFSQFCRTC
jgi:hypothetical protein